MSAARDRAAITLRALQGRPLADERVRRTVEACARAIAERNGVELLALGVDPGGGAITVEIGAHRLAALGFAAELRRLTNAWHLAKFGPPALWGELPGADGDDGPWSDGADDEWRR